MTTESLSPASRIVIETFSRPLGERSTSISLTGDVASAWAGAGALARGATLAATGVSEGAKDGPGAADADSGAPNTAPWFAGCPLGAPDRADGRRPCRPAWRWRTGQPDSQPGPGTAPRRRPSVRRGRDLAPLFVPGSRGGFACPPAARGATGSAARLIAVAASRAGVISAGERLAAAAEGGEIRPSCACARPGVESGARVGGPGAPLSLSPPAGAGPNEGASVSDRPAAAADA